MAELLPCPYCGSNATVGYEYKCQFGMSGWVSDCSNCTKAPRYSRITRERSIEAWNYGVSEIEKAKAYLEKSSRAGQDSILNLKGPKDD